MRENLNPHLTNEWDCFYQQAVEWWEKEALSTEKAPFPSGPYPNFSCYLQLAGTLSQVGDFAATPAVTKLATPSGLRTLSFDLIKSDFSAPRKVADIGFVQSLLLFFEYIAGKFEKKPSHLLRERSWAFLQR